jgi:hypothetical protein
MAIKTLPPSVAEVLGEKASQDLMLWFQDQMSATPEAGIQISDFVARQKVNVLMLEQISNLLLAGTPELIQDEGRGWVWRVPVELTFPSRGRVGQVALLDVDARYGYVYYDAATLKEAQRRTDLLTEQIFEKKP